MNHLRVHSNERPFFCIICKNKFKSRESLMKHKWIHTGLKPLKCHHCDKEFRIKESFERHMSKSHGDNVQLPEIYFEISETSESESSSQANVISNFREDSEITDQVNVISTIRDSELTDETDSYLFESRFILGSRQKKSQNIDSNSVIEIVTGINKDSASELTSLSNSGSEIQFTYPVLASHLANESDSSMNILSNSLSGNIDPKLIDMESSISNNDNARVGSNNSSNSNISTKESIETNMTLSKHQLLVDDVLKSQLENTVTQRSEKLFVLKNTTDRMSQEELTNNGITNLAGVGEITDMDESNTPTFKIVMQQIDGTLSNVVVDVPEEKNHNILIVSDGQVFRDGGQNLSLLSSQVIGQELINTVGVNHVQIAHVTEDYNKEPQ
ncbi:unnamed protein product, partial [Meganyctiphanes norvegica]